MSFRTFMGSIGNAFKTGWNNGNIQKGMAATGMAAFTVGLTGNMIHDMKHSGSIFGSGCGCNSFGFGNNMFGCSPFGMGNMNMFGSSPFSMMGGGMNMFGMNNMYGGMDMYGGMGMLNGMNGMGNNMAYQWGQMLRVQLESQQGMYPGMNFNYQPKEFEALSYSNTDAGEISSSVTTEKGEEFDEGTTALGTDSNADDVTIAEDVTNGRTSDKEKYRTGLSAIAQSHAKQIGGDEGKIDFDEYYAHEIDSFRKQFPNATDEQLEMMIKNAFVQMDLNGDGNIDWKEMASTIATYDAAGSGSGKLDGKISKTDYSQAQKILVNGTFGKANWSNYKTLFGNPEKTE